jgi:hypothetical protein
MDNIMEGNPTKEIEEKKLKIEDMEIEIIKKEVY